MAFSRFEINTGRGSQFINITSACRDLVGKAEITEGTCLVYVPHTTAGITINEAADPAVVRDISAQLSKLVPAHAGYTHAEGNSDAHIKACIMGSSVQIPVVDGKLVLGTWQGIFFCEFDGPRRRSVHVQVSGN
jgi:secondary thiamine-phosphate synthase enzyme